MLTRRATALTLTLAAHLLLLLLLLRLAPPLVPRRAGTTLTTFEVAPEARKAVPRPRAAASAKGAAPPPPDAPPIPPRPDVPAMPALIPGLENFDLRNVPSSPGQADSADRGSASGGSTYGPGDGPGGVRLYNAEWHREPTQAELAFYLPARRQPGWGMIACQTIARNRVDNCKELASEPPGSGLSRAIRQAAWQFQIRPPRVDGKPVIGAWVRIRIDYTETGAEIDRSRGR